MEVVEGRKKTDKAGGDAPLGTIRVVWRVRHRSAVPDLAVNTWGKCEWARVGMSRSWGWGQ